MPLSTPTADIVSPATVHDSAMQWMSPPTRSSESTSDGVVAWFGPLSFRSSPLCEVELVCGVTPDYRLTQMLVSYLLNVWLAAWHHCHCSHPLRHYHCITESKSVPPITTKCWKQKKQYPETYSSNQLPTGELIVPNYPQVMTGIFSAWEWARVRSSGP